jgi:hypothetical protein
MSREKLFNIKRGSSMRRRIEVFQGYMNPSFFALNFSFSWLPPYLGPMEIN